MSGATPGPATSGDRRARRFVLVAGLALGVLTFLWLFPGLDRVGVSWDEPRYFVSVTRIQEWTAAVASGPNRAHLLSSEAIREAWDWARYWNPHPPAYKIAMATTEALFGRWTGAVVGYRIAPLAFFSLLVAGVTWLAGLTWGRAAGVGAGLALMLMPRVVGHAHIAATDIPLSLAWFAGSVGLALYVMSGARRHLVLGAIGLGLALATKFTGYLLPLAVLLWMIAYGRSRRAITGAILWGLGGLVVAYVINPLMWHDPLYEFVHLVRDSVLRDELIPINTYYLGRVWGYTVPGHHAVVMSLVTVPLALLVLAGWGGAAEARAWEDRPIAGLCFTQILFWLALMAAPGSPNHDGVRLWLPMFPFVALLAGRGFGSVTGLVLARTRGREAVLALLALGALLFLPAYLQTVRVAPLYLSYYNEVIGGPRGAARVGMEATYWLEAVTPSFLDRVNRTLPPGARLAARPNTAHYEYLQSYGMLRDDVEVTRDGPPDYLLLVARKAAFSPEDWRIYGNVRPELAVELDGVELAGLYAWSSEDAATPDREEPEP